QDCSEAPPPIPPLNGRPASPRPAPAHAASVEGPASSAPPPIAPTVLTFPRGPLRHRRREQGVLRGPQGLRARGGRLLSRPGGGPVPPLRRAPDHDGAAHRRSRVGAGADPRDRGDGPAHASRGPAGGRGGGGRRRGTRPHAG